MALTILLFSVFLFGLVLLAVGIAILIKAKNKLAGIITSALGFVFTVLPIGVYLFITITTSVTGGM
jgi:hypothetical protein